LRDSVSILLWPMRRCCFTSWWSIGCLLLDVVLG
jgi:hypothetical protein